MLGYFVLIFSIKLGVVILIIAEGLGFAEEFKEN